MSLKKKWGAAFVAIVIVAFNYWWWGPAREERLRFEKQQNPIAIENLNFPSFEFPEKYPGFNRSVLEQRQKLFLLHQLNFRQQDVDKLLQRQKSTIHEINAAMSMRPHSIGQESQLIRRQLQKWLRLRLGQQEFTAYSHFVQQTENELASKKEQFEQQQRSRSH